MKSKVNKKNKKKSPKFYSVLGGMFRMRRVQLGLSQRDVAKKLKLSDPATISAMESGNRQVPQFHLAKLSAILLVNLHQVYEAWDLDVFRRMEANKWLALNKRQGLV